MAEGKIVYLALEQRLYEMLEAFACMKGATVEKVIMDAAVCFCAMLIDLPVKELVKNPDLFGFRDFLRDTEYAAEMGF